LPVWFTVRLADRPGSLAALAGALARQGVNISGIVGVAEDTGGALMLTTSEPEITRSVLVTLSIPYEMHDAAGTAPSGLGSVQRGLADRGLDVRGDAS
jgi:hypothetical protein